MDAVVAMDPFSIPAFGPKHAPTRGQPWISELRYASLRACMSVENLVGTWAHHFGEAPEAESSTESDPRQAPCVHL